MRCIHWFSHGRRMKLYLKFECKQINDNFPQHSLSLLCSGNFKIYKKKKSCSIWLTYMDVNFLGWVIYIVVATTTTTTTTATTKKAF